MVVIPLRVRQLAQEHESALKGWLYYLGLSQGDLAERLNVRQPTISLYCKGRNIRKSSLKKIAQALGIEPEQLDFNPKKISLMVFLDEEYKEWDRLHRVGKSTN